MFFNSKKNEIPPADATLPGREKPIDTAEEHFILGTPLKGPYPENTQIALFGLGCFWGAEKVFWQLPGVVNSAVGYAAGGTPNPTYQEVCSGKTGHNEVVQVVFDPELISYKTLLVAFFEAHNPTQGMRQGNDMGTQYRSGIYTSSEEQQQQAKDMLANYKKRLSDAGYDPITTEIVEAQEFYFAEGAHQQYLAKNLNGYCGLGGTGVSCG